MGTATQSLAAHSPRHHPAEMFVVTEADAAAIRAVYEQRGEFAAAVELASALPWHHRQHAGSGVRSHHRRLEAAAATAGEADAEADAVTSSRLTPTCTRRL
jgi:hypothetical protein